MAASSVAAAGPAPVPSMMRRGVQAAAVVLAVCLAAAFGFIAGEHHQPRPHPPGMTVLTGVGYVGVDEASITVGNWVYGIEGAGNLLWTDIQGSVHTFGWPACLQTGRRVPITFGYVPVTTPDGVRTRHVVWVDCRSS